MNYERMDAFSHGKKDMFVKVKYRYLKFEQKELNKIQSLFHIFVMIISNEKIITPMSCQAY